MGDAQSYSSAVSQVTLWRHRAAEILTLCALAFLWARVVGWLASPWWGWLRAAAIVGGVVFAAVAYERGKRFGRRSSEPPPESQVETPATASARFAWYERTGVAWWTLVVAYWIAMEAGPFWSDLALSAALVPVVVWWERRWRRARLRPTHGAFGPAYCASSAASIAWGREVAKLLSAAWLVLVALCFLGFVIWCFAWAWGCHRGRREAHIADLLVAGADPPGRVESQDR